MGEFKLGICVCYTVLPFLYISPVLQRIFLYYHISIVTEMMTEYAFYIYIYIYI